MGVTYRLPQTGLRLKCEFPTLRLMHAYNVRPPKRGVNRMRWQLRHKILVALILTPSLIASRPLLSQGYSMSAAVDAQGVRHQERDYGRKIAPWNRDLIYAPRPRYPYEVRAKGQGGSGFFRIILDLSSGNVVKVTTIKSTGSPVLDNAAISAFRQWRFKPGKWKEIDLPITFTMHGLKY